MPATYESAGVNLDVYQETMSRLPRLLHRTYSPRVLNLDGGFAGLFKLDFTNSLFARNYQDPVLVACSDGVGTKIKLAIAMDRHDTVGIDLVAMSINDALCCGAEPLFFLDYVAMEKDVPNVVEQLVQGISDGCVEADCALLGGETAVMPGLYSAGDYDLAGFCVGVVERKQLIDGKAINRGDVVLGLASDGLHSNGFSLVRSVIDEAGISLDDYEPQFESTVGDELLKPTRIYVRALRRVHNHYKVKNVVHGIAHITGGGLQENIERVLPKGVELRIDEGSWDVPPIFPYLQELGIEPAEMARVFNMGIGMALMVSPYYADKIQRILEGAGQRSWIIGEIE